VSVLDRAGIVRAVEVDDGPWAADDGISLVDGRPGVLSVSWLGGACDTGAELTIEALADGFRLVLETRVEPGGCRLIGISRRVLIVLNRVVALQQFTFHRPGGVVN
jgi:hypothetical protein